MSKAEIAPHVTWESENTKPSAYKIPNYFFPLHKASETKIKALLCCDWPAFGTSTFLSNSAPKESS